MDLTSDVQQQPLQAPVYSPVHGRRYTDADDIKSRIAECLTHCFHSKAEAGDFEVIRASVARRDQVDAMFDEIADRHGRLDILVNNAASGALLPLSEVDDSHWQRAFDTNLRGSLWCAQRAADLMPAGGAIVNVSSIGSNLVGGLIDNEVAGMFPAADRSAERVRKRPRSATASALRRNWPKWSCS